MRRRRLPPRRHPSRCRQGPLPSVHPSGRPRPPNRGRTDGRRGRLRRGSPGPGGPRRARGRRRPSTRTRTRPTARPSDRPTPGGRPRVVEQDLYGTVLTPLPVHRGARYLWDVGESRARTGYGSDCGQPDQLDVRERLSPRLLCGPLTTVACRRSPRPACAVPGAGPRGRLVGGRGEGRDVGASELLIALDRDCGTPLQQQMCDQVTALVRSGRLWPGEAVPASRELARQLDVPRTVITRAYELLCAQGVLTARPARPGPARLRHQGRRSRERRRLPRPPRSTAPTALAPWP